MRARELTKAFTFEAFEGRVGAIRVYTGEEVKQDAVSFGQWVIAKTKEWAFRKYNALLAAHTKIGEDTLYQLNP